MRIADCEIADQWQNVRLPDWLAAGRERLVFEGADARLKAGLRDPMASLLAEFRIPHHALPRRWFATVDALQIIWVVLALELVRKTRLDLAGCELGPEALAVLVGSPQLAQLCNLRLDFNPLGFPGLLRLVGSPLAGSLEHLSLSSCQLEEGAAQTLAGYSMAFTTPTVSWCATRAAGSPER